LSVIGRVVDIDYMHPMRLLCLLVVRHCYPVKRPADDARRLPIRSAAGLASVDVDMRDAARDCPGPAAGRVP
jgi:hypothetical protein